MRRSIRFILIIAIFLFIFSPGIKSEIVEISDNIYSKDPCVLPFDNKVMVMWAEEVSGNFDLYYRICSGGAWGPKTRFNTGIYNSIYPQLELAPDGKVHAIWMGKMGEARAIYHAYYTDGVWSTPEEVYPSTRRSCWPRLGIMSNGILCSIWTQAVGSNDQNAIYYTFKTSSWWGPGCLTNTPDTTSIHADLYARDDKVYACWMDAEGPNYWNLWFSQKQWGGNWTTPVIVASCYAQFPAMAVDSKGDVHSIFYGGGGDTPYYINRVNGSWSSPVQLPYLGKFTKSFVSLDVDKWDYLHAVWRQEHNATDDIGYVNRDEQGNWGTPEYVSNSSVATGCGASKPLVRVDNNGYAHIVWLDRRSESVQDEGKIFYNSVQYKADQQIQTLVIQSAPVFGVPITVSPDDINGDGDGNTDFMRIYNEGIMISLTAPEVYNDRDFIKWIIDGTDNDSRTIQLNMDNYHMVDAIYETDGYEDAGTSVIQTPDGGYIIAGYSNAYTHGAYDFLIYKLDSNGKTQLRRFLGGATGDEYAYDVKQTIDQGYIVVGSTTSFTHGNSDILVYKMDANGNKQWRKNFGGVQDEEGFSVHQTSDGGYILAGYTYSFTHGEGDSDFLVYKLDGNGNKQWRKNFGGINEDKAYSIVQTSDGGYIVSGQTKSFVHGVEDTDLLVYKLSSNGSKQWRRNYGGDLDEEGGMIQKTSDGGHILVGGSYSFTHGYRDFIAYKLNANGSKQWRKNFGGTNEDACFSVKQTSDGGYILAGCTYSFTHGDCDLLIYKINSSGIKQWRRNYGGIGEDRAFSIIQTSDGGYMIVGDTRSFVNTPGYKDFLLYKLDANGSKQWRKNLGI